MIYLSFSAVCWQPIYIGYWKLLIGECSTSLDLDPVLHVILSRLYINLTKAAYNIFMTQVLGVRHFVVPLGQIELSNPCIAVDMVPI